MQIDLTQFLEKGAEKFMADLWELLLDAQDGFQGIPKQLIEQSRAQMEERRVCCDVCI